MLQILLEDDSRAAIASDSGPSSASVEPSFSSSSRANGAARTVQEAEEMSNAIHAAKKQLRLAVRNRLAALDQATLQAQCEGC